jgi:hypothetical protein
MNKILALAIIGAFAVAGSPAFGADAPAATAPATKAPAATAPATKAPAAAAAAPAAAAENSQQNKMKTCQAEAGEKKLEGKNRQDYVNNCLKAKPAKPESKMAMCNKKTAGLKGDERSKAQSECMKGG